MDDYTLICQRVQDAASLCGLDRAACSDCQRRAIQHYDNGNSFKDAIDFGRYLAKWRSHWALYAGRVEDVA